jgi:hypothetical protein
LLLQNVIDIHGQVLALAGANRKNMVDGRLNGLFHLPGPTGVPAALQPDVPIIPGVFFSFKRDSGCIASLTSIRGKTSADPRTLELNLVDPGTSGWFTFEVNLPWREIRSARRLDLSLAARASKALDCRVVLAGLDTENVRHEFGTTDLVIPDKPTVVQTKLDVVIPHTVRLNEDNWPKFIIYFALTSFSLDIDYLDLALS